MSQLEEIESIKQLKYKYFRCLDSKRWAELAECFAPDATSSYDGGKYSFQGRDQIIGFLERALGRPEHDQHAPRDITRRSSSRARPPRPEPGISKTR